jgi:hypothetical protein
LTNRNMPFLNEPHNYVLLSHCIQSTLSQMWTINLTRCPAESLAAVMCYWWFLTWL